MHLDITDVKKRNKRNHLNKEKLFHNFFINI